MTTHTGSSLRLERHCLATNGWDTLSRMDPAALVARLREAWRRSDSLFDLLELEALLARPIPLRHPVIFYLGHFPAFAWNQACRGVLGRPSFDPVKDDLFERGIDPRDDEDYRAPESEWPEPAAILEYRDRVRAALVEGAAEAVERGRGDILERVLEHEMMHHETLTYMLLRLPPEQKRRPAGVRFALEGAPPRGSVHVPGGRSRWALPGRRDASAGTTSSRSSGGGSAPSTWTCSRCATPRCWSS